MYIHQQATLTLWGHHLFQPATYVRQLGMLPGWVRVVGINQPLILLWCCAGHELWTMPCGASVRVNSWWLTSSKCLFGYASATHIHFVQGNIAAKLRTLFLLGRDRLYAMNWFSAGLCWFCERGTVSQWNHRESTALPKIQNWFCFLSSNAHNNIMMFKHAENKCVIPENLNPICNQCEFIHVLVLAYCRLSCEKQKFFQLGAGTWYLNL